MKENYQIIVDKELNYDSDSLQQSSIDAQCIQEGQYHLIHQNKSFKAEVISSNFNSKTYKVKINQNEYEIAIQTPLDLLIKEMGFEVGKAQIVNALHAPMPGLIFEINVEVGDTIEEKQPLLILEAMKMENVLVSPRSGVIKSIEVEKGEAVDKGLLLIEFE